MPASQHACALQDECASAHRPRCFGSMSQHLLASLLPSTCKPQQESAGLPGPAFMSVHLSCVPAPLYPEPLYSDGCHSSPMLPKQLCCQQTPDVCSLSCPAMCLASNVALQLVEELLCVLLCTAPCWLQHVRLHAIATRTAGAASAVMLSLPCSCILWRSVTASLFLHLLAVLLCSVVLD